MHNLTRVLTIACDTNGRQNSVRALDMQTTVRRDNETWTNQQDLPY